MNHFKNWTSQRARYIFGRMLEAEVKLWDIHVPPGKFVLRGRTGSTDPYDVNRLALMAYAMQIVEALSERGQCSKDVYQNAKALNEFGQLIGTRYQPGMNNEAAYLRYIKARFAVLEDWRVA